MQFRQSGHTGLERFDMHSVVMERGADDTLSGRTWRRIPFSELEMFMKLPEIREILTSPCDVAPPTLEGLADYFAATEHLVKTQLTLPSGMLVGDGSEETPKGKFPMIKAPEGRLTDEHLQDVAQAYRWLSDANKPPAPAIADMAGVPVRTVHRWVYEARKRGILPPARSGRAG